jgi:ABC-type nitrate/sulfonate/bicarbonate transport system ATPase subunit
MAINRTGFVQTNQGLEIDKDVEAQLAYTFDWSTWLEDGDTIASVTYTAAARRNDPTPLVVESSGLADSNTDTYVELSGGQVDKTYIVTAKVTTSDGLIDRRSFRVKVVARSA